MSSTPSPVASTFTADRVGVSQAANALSALAGPMPAQRVTAESADRSSTSPPPKSRMVSFAAPVLSQGAV